MAYYDIYIGDKPFKLYIEDQQYDLYMDDLPEGVYGKISYTYDPSSENFNIKIDKLNKKATKLLNEGNLYFAIEYKIGYGGSWHCLQRRTLSTYVGQGICKRKTRFNTKRLWIATPTLSVLTRSLNGLVGQQLKPNDLNISLNKKQIIGESFSVGDVYRNHSNARTIIYANEEHGNHYIDIRFYLFNTYECRFLKTLCNPFRIEKPFTQL